MCKTSSRQIFHIIFRRFVLEAAQIWWELFHIIFRQIVLEAAQIWREPQQKNRHLFSRQNQKLTQHTAQLEKKVPPAYAK